MRVSNGWIGPVAVSVLVAIVVNAAGSVPLLAQSGGSFQITNSVVAAGGGESKDVANNRFAHEGTVGEHAAGTLLRHPPFSQTAGLWASNVGLTPTASQGFVSGRILASDGAPLAGVTMNLSGSRLVRSITDGNGIYSFVDLEVGGFYTVTPSRANYSFSPRDLTFSLLANKTDAVFTGAPAEVTANPLDTTEFFVRQHYLDFLNREPEQAGFEYWSNRLDQCRSSQVCIRNARIDLSNAFFFELEFQQTGSYVFRLHRAAFGNSQPFSNPDTANLSEARKLPSYSVFVADRARVIGGIQLAASQLALANLMVQRPEFLAKYPASLDGESFISAVLSTVKADSGADLGSQRETLTMLFNSGGRAAVLYRLADDNAQSNPINNRPFIDAEYNRSFVFTEYTGYLRRDADIAGFLFWLGQVDTAPLRDVPSQHRMMCSFITSAEYQQRFSPVVTRTNQDCSQ